MSDKKELTLEKMWYWISKYENRFNIYLNINFDDDICNIILMINEWEVDGAYSFLTKPYTEEKLIEALNETIKVVMERNYV